MDSCTMVLVFHFGKWDTTSLRNGPELLLLNIFLNIFCGNCRATDAAQLTCNISYVFVLNKLISSQFLPLISNDIISFLFFQTETLFSLIMKLTILKHTFECLVSGESIDMTSKGE